MLCSRPGVSLLSPNKLGSATERCREGVTIGIRPRPYAAPVAKPAVQFACTECGTASGRWFGRCPGCSAFGTLVEEVVGQVAELPKAAAKPLLRLVDVEVEEARRISTGVPELDRVLGGGLVPASLVLVGGEPGVGKSTLLLTALQEMSKIGRASCRERVFNWV